MHDFMTSHSDNLQFTHLFQLAHTHYLLTHSDYCVIVFLNRLTHMLQACHVELVNVSKCLLLIERFVPDESRH